MSKFIFVEASPLEPEIGSVSYVPAVSGTALVRARGWCNVEGSGTGSNEIILKLGKTQASADLTELAEWGVIRLEKLGAAGTDQALAFSAETTVPVVAGANESVSLFAAGNGAGEKSCSGTIVIQGIF